MSLNAILVTVSKHLNNSYVGQTRTSLFPKLTNAKVSGVQKKHVNEYHNAQLTRETLFQNSKIYTDYISVKLS